MGGNKTRLRCPEAGRGYACMKKREAVGVLKGVQGVMGVGGVPCHALSLLLITPVRGRGG